jgi:tryptophanyl-tRNA synthetase
LGIVRGVYKEGRPNDVHLIGVQHADMADTSLRSEPFLEPMRERRAVYEAKPNLVDEILAAGNAKTRKIAQETVRMMDEAMGLLYFKN